MESDIKDKEWFKTWFNNDYLKLYEHRNAKEAEAFLKFLTSKELITSTDIVLDLACGAGRYLKILRNWKYNAWGVDLSSELLRQAKNRIKNETENTRLIQGDIRCLPFAQKFDVVASFFTSFGYFEDKDNILVLKEIYRILKFNGKLIIDYFNADYIIANLAPHTEKQWGEIQVRENRYYHAENKRLIKEIIFQEADREEKFLESLRCYSLEEFKTMLDQVGFRLHSVFGNYNGGNFTVQAPRMIIIGEKSVHHPL
jgi:ubiquinone/menaquinone biosynthesis C-methylase UbiE